MINSSVSPSALEAFALIEPILIRRRTITCWIATLSLERSSQDEESQMTDYNLIHCQWEIHYTISNPVSFFEQLWTGRSEDWGQVENFLRSELADVVIVTSANRDINEILYGSGRDK